MVIVVVVRVRLVEVGVRVVVVRLSEADGVIVVVVQVVMVENGAATAMPTRRVKRAAKRPKVTVVSFMIAELGEVLRWDRIQYEKVWMEDLLKL